jgi:outer membrane murein-binding lipoprotein Lpp
VLVRLDAVEGQLVSFGGRMKGFENELRSSMRSLEGQVGRLAEDVLKVRADQRGAEERMDKFESKAT